MTPFADLEAMMGIETSAVDRRDELASRLAEIKTRIRNYPPPIAGCDVQFQSLVDEREMIVGRLKELDGEI